MKKAAVLLAAGASVMLVFGGATSAQAVAPAAAATAGDVTFVHDNAQTDLAEITIGKIALSRAQSAAARTLATTTIADHKAALAKLTTAAAAVNAALPTAPNAAQQADAATLQSVVADQFDATYAQIQIAGHKLSIAGTKTELAGGSNTDVKNFASGYLPVAQMHLSMSEALLSTVSGAAPTAVPAGSGGAGAPTSTGTRVVQLTLGALGLILLGFAATLTLRRRRTS